MEDDEEEEVNNVRSRPPLPLSMAVPGSGPNLFVNTTVHSFPPMPHSRNLTTGSPGAPTSSLPFHSQSELSLSHHPPHQMSQHHHHLQQQQHLSLQQHQHQQRAVALSRVSPPLTTSLTNTTALGSTLGSTLGTARLDLPAEENIELEELEEFAKEFKQRRIKLGYTQV